MSSRGGTTKDLVVFKALVRKNSRFISIKIPHSALPHPDLNSGRGKWALYTQQTSKCTPHYDRATIFALSGMLLGFEAFFVWF
ncbi:MAG: hypothetical protein JXR70_19610 [Spirochaetales bacterium]|nr:hypothetical protein [Spirochaetales bacterium]